MNLLLDVRQMLIRATYSPSQSSSSIKEISVETADPNSRSGTPASKVEQCDCQAGYTGE